MVQVMRVDAQPNDDATDGHLVVEIDRTVAGRQPTVRVVTSPGAISTGTSTRPTRFEAHSSL